MTTLSKAEYLKRYTSDSTTEKKRKKRKIARETKNYVGYRIVDDDVDFKSLLPENTDTTAYEDVEENGPTIADVIDERPDHIKKLEAYRSEKWKGLKSHDGDQSPHRKQRHDSDTDQSPPRKQRHDSDSDQSPPRKRRHDSDSDQSPPRKQRHDSDSDQSPPRKQRHDSDSDQSPPRKQRHDSDSDQSPPRRKRHDSDSDQSPPRKQRHDSNSDQSPPRRKRHNSNSDQSPPRRQKNSHDSDRSLHRKKKYSSDSDQSPPRQSKLAKADKDFSLKSNHKQDSDSSPPRTHGSRSDKMGKTLSGKKAGLSTARDMKIEADLSRKKEDDAFKRIDSEILGKDAKTQFRKSGRQQKKKDSEPTPEELKRREELSHKYTEWGKGLKQTEEKAARLQDHMYEMSKPLARYRDDDDLDVMLKEQERVDDPMLAFIKKKKTKDKARELPKYSGPPPPPNRYGIMPGYRWDGVDRSNGFEKSIYSKISDKKAVADMAYKWSVEDM